jgi:hypothetical protein
MDEWEKIRSLRLNEKRRPERDQKILFLGRGGTCRSATWGTTCRCTACGSATWSAAWGTLKAKIMEFLDRKFSIAVRVNTVGRCFVHEFLPGHKILFALSDKALK